MIALLRYPVTRRVFERGHADLRAWVARLRRDPDAVLKQGNLELPFSLMTTSQLMRLFDPDGTKPVTSMKLVRELSHAGFEKVYLNELIKTGVSGPQKLWAVRNRKALLTIVKPSKLREIYDAERNAFADKYKKEHTGG